MVRDVISRDMMHRDVIRRGVPGVSELRPIMSRLTMSNRIASRSILSLR